MYNNGYMRRYIVNFQLLINTKCIFSFSTFIFNVFKLLNKRMMGNHITHRKYVTSNCSKNILLEYGLLLCGFINYVQLL